MFSTCQKRRWVSERCNSYEFVLEYAALCGFLDIVELCKKRGVENYANAFAFAAGGGHIEIVKLCKERGASNFNKAMCWAAEVAH